MRDSARAALAVQLWLIIRAAVHPADRVLQYELRQRRFIGSHDRRAITAMVYRWLRAQARLQWWQARLPVIAQERAIEWLPLLLIEQQSPAALAEIFSGETFMLAPLHDTEWQAVAQLADTPLNHHAMPDPVRLECPPLVWDNLAVLGETPRAEVLAALLHEAPLDIRVNTLRATVAAVQQHFNAQALAYAPHGLRLPQRQPLEQHPLYKDGSIEIQDQGSQLVAEFVAPKAGERVLDVCAGAGGKTLALAALMRNQGTLVGLDSEALKVKRAQERLRRAGVHNTTMRHEDAVTSAWLKRNAEKFDRVLVDAPCSGSGTWRRNPDARWRYDAAAIERLQKTQLAILSAASQTVKKGGKLVYATCSLLPAENDNVIEYFLQQHPDFQAQPVPARSCFPVETHGAAALRLLPHQHDSDGFYAACLTRHGHVT